MFASHFLDNAAKTCSYGLKISENIKIKHVFQSKSFLHHSVFFHTICLSAFKNLGESGLLIKGISETIKNEANE